MNYEKEKPKHHQAVVVQVKEIIPHNNADTLELVSIPNTDYKVVVKKGEFKTGDFGVYIYPDSVVPQTLPFKFIWEGQVGIDGIVPEKRRRVTVRKFRGEWSEGLLLPVSCFGILYTLQAKEGDDVSDALNITHYNPPEPVENFNGQKPKPYSWMPKSIRGWFFFMLRLVGLDPEKVVGGRAASGPKNSPPVYDVEALKNYTQAFTDGETVVVTEKIHGSNARFQFSNGKMYAGSHRQWKHPNAQCIWNKALQQLPWIEEWCRLNEGCTLYGEVTPTQAGFKYGATDDQVRFFVFDVMTPEGDFLEWWNFNNILSDDKTKHLKLSVAKARVPLLYCGAFDLQRLKALAEEPTSAVPGATNIREGIVIQPVKNRYVRGIGRLKLKLVSNTFLLKDSK